MVNELLEESSHRDGAIADVQSDFLKTVIFGAGGSGKHALLGVGDRIACVGDSDLKNKIDAMFRMSVIAPEQLQEDSETMVFLASDWSGEHGRQLQLNKLLEEISHRYVAIDDVLSDVSQVIVFGAGGSGKHAIRVLQELGITVVRVCDNDRKKQGDTVCGVPVIAPEQLQEYPETMVFVASDWGGDIGKQLQKMGIKYYYFGFAFDFKRWKSHYVPEQILGSAEEIEAAYALLSDESSRATYRALLKYRLTLDSAFFLPADVPPYFHPQALPVAGDIILDGGAWSGDTALEFVRALDGDCTIYSFEPEPVNYQKLLATIEEEKLESVVIPCHIGMWHETTTLTFDTSLENSMQYHVSDSGDQKIAVTTIDDFVRERGLKVDVIKMDIEGSEVNALRGAAETLLRDRPKLMISAYHEPDDMWKVPLMINSINPDYRFYLAHHRQSPLDYVLYAKCVS